MTAIEDTIWVTDPAVDKIVFEKTASFIRDVGVNVWEKLKAFAVGTWQNLEGIAILSGASIGFTYLLGELPFIFMLPAWVEGAMVAPIASVMIVLGLLWIAKKRQAYRGH